MNTERCSYKRHLSKYFSKLGYNQTYQKNSPILVSPSNTRTPVGVKPRLYSLPSLACRADMEGKTGKEKERKDETPKETTL